MDKKFDLYWSDEHKGKFNSYNDALIALQELSPQSWDYSLKHGWDIITEGYHKTSKEHYLKYSQMAQECNISFNDQKSRFLGYTMSQLENQYQKSRYLNGIPFYKFDGYFHFWRMRKIGPRSLAENTCMYKHVLIYHVLRLIPKFTDEYSLCDHCGDEFLTSEMIKDEYAPNKFFLSCEECNKLKDQHGEE